MVGAGRRFSDPGPGQIKVEGSVSAPAAHISRPKDLSRLALLAPCSDRIVGLRAFDHPSWKPPSTRCPYGTIAVQKPWPVLIAGMITDAVPGSSCCNWLTPAFSFVLQSQPAGRGPKQKPSVRDGGARANEASLGHPYAVLSWPWSGLSMVGKGFLGRGCKACLLRPPGSWKGPLPASHLPHHPRYFAYNLVWAPPRRLLLSCLLPPHAWLYYLCDLPATETTG